MEDIYKKLTDYTFALKEALNATKEASERPILTNHLASAAEMFATLHQSGNVASIQEIVKSEVRAHGWSFISGQTGETVTKKWVVFANAVGVQP